MSSGKTAALTQRCSFQLFHIYKSIWFVSNMAASAGFPHSLLLIWGWERVPAFAGNPPSKEAFRTSSRFPAITKSRSAWTLAGSSSRSFSFLFGRTTRFTPARCAAKTLSLIPPTWWKEKTRRFAQNKPQTNCFNSWSALTFWKKKIFTALDERGEKRSQSSRRGNWKQRGWKIRQ